LLIASLVTLHIITVESRDLRKHYFSARIVNIWNSLPNTVVDASTVNTVG